MTGLSSNKMQMKKFVVMQTFLDYNKKNTGISKYFGKNV
jgi:hypothetical protein